MTKEKIFKRLGYGILLIFSILFFILVMGYYETAEQKRVLLTEQQINEFEKAIAAGDDVLIEDYLKNNYVDYSNNFSKKMTKISDGIEDTFEKSIKYIFKEISDMVENE